MADAGNYNSRSVQDFVWSVLNAIMSLQSNAENADRSRETTNSDRFTSVESEINSRFQIPIRIFCIGLQAHYGIKYAPNEILDRSAIIITSVRHPATQNQHRRKIFDCEVAGSMK